MVRLLQQTLVHLFQVSFFCCAAVPDSVSFKQTKQIDNRFVNQQKNESKTILITDEFHSVNLPTSHRFTASTAN